jgi:hypothetical protein
MLWCIHNWCFDSETQQLIPPTVKKSLSRS